MKKLNFNDLGFYIGSIAKKEFNKWYSTDTNDYTDNIKDEYLTELDADSLNIVVYKSHIELTEKNHMPLIIEWLSVYIYDEKDNIIDINYYVD